MPGTKYVPLLYDTYRYVGKKPETTYENGFKWSTNSSNQLNKSTNGIKYRIKRTDIGYPPFGNNSLRYSHRTNSHISASEHNLYNPENNNNNNTSNDNNTNTNRHSMYYQQDEYGPANAFRVSFFKS